MGDKRITASARVQVIVEFPCESWGEGYNLDQVFEEAASAITRKVQTMISKEGGRIIGEPTVIAVLVEKKP